MTQLSAASLDEIISLIYETAVMPEKWTDLLSSLAEYVEHTHLPDQTKSSPIFENMLSGHSEKPSQNTLSKVLQHLPDTFPKIRTEQNQSSSILLSHFQRALAIAKKLADAHAQSESVHAILNQLPVGLFIVDEDATIQTQNTLATTLLKENKHLTVTAGKLTSDYENGSHNLRKAIKDAARRTAHPNLGEAIQLISNDDPDNTLFVLIVPTQNNDIEVQGHAAVFISSLKMHPAKVSAEFASLYQLTERETQVTNHLINGESLDQIAANTHVSKHTIRSQIKSIYQKTNTNRQAELVTRMLTGPAAFSFQQLPTNVTSTINTVPSISLPDGRRMAYETYGDPQGRPLVLCHSLLGCRLETPFDADQLCQEKGIRLIVPDRPGFGQSDAHTDGDPESWSNDLAHLADHLGLDSFIVAGYSLGGLYASTCAFKLRNRISHLLLVSFGCAPQSQADFDEILPLYRMNMRLARRVPTAHRMLTAITRQAILRHPKSFTKAITEKLSGEDRRIGTSERFLNRVNTALREGYQQSSHRAARDLEFFMQPWPFSPEEVLVPSTIWYGNADQNIPSRVCERLANRLPNASVHILPEAGHFLYFSHWSEILESLPE